MVGLRADLIFYSASVGRRWRSEHTFNRLTESVFRPRIPLGCVFFVLLSQCRCPYESKSPRIRRISLRSIFTKVGPWAGARQRCLEPSPLGSIPNGSTLREIPQCCDGARTE